MATDGVRPHQHVDGRDSLGGADVHDGDGAFGVSRQEAVDDRGGAAP